jgi:hypothetical protein
MSDKIVIFEYKYFNVTSRNLVLPLEDKGEIWHRGWDIPSYWATDNTGQCWMSDGHSTVLFPVSSEKLYEAALTALEATNKEKMELDRIIAVLFFKEKEKLENDC